MFVGIGNARTKGLKGQGSCAVRDDVLLDVLVEIETQCGTCISRRKKVSPVCHFGVANRIHSPSSDGAVSAGTMHMHLQ